MKGLVISNGKVARTATQSQQDNEVKLPAVLKTEL
jgi:hypothetical protein